jgi:hypothetical protein
MTDVQATGEASSFRKRTSRNSKQYISLLFSCLLVLFRPPESGFSRPKKWVLMHIRIHNTDEKSWQVRVLPKKKLKWDKDNI